MPEFLTAFLDTAGFIAFPLVLLVLVNWWSLRP
jgi:hypothetical protein